MNQLNRVVFTLGLVAVAVAPANVSGSLPATRLRQPPARQEADPTRNTE